MNLTEELSVVSHKTLGSLKRCQHGQNEGRAGALTIITPHNSISIDSQMLGRSLLRSILLGTYKNMLEM